VRLGDGECFIDVVMGAINVRDNAALQTPRAGIVFFLRDIVVSSIQKLAGLVEATVPRHVGVHVNVVVHVFAVVDGRLFYFIDGVVDLLNGVPFFGM